MTAASVPVLQFVTLPDGRWRALEVNEFDPTCLAFKHCFLLETQPPYWSSVTTLCSSKAWPGEMRRGCTPEHCLRFHQNGPVINVYLCHGGGAYFSVKKNDSVMEIHRTWKKHQKDKRFWSNFRKKAARITSTMLETSACQSLVLRSGCPGGRAELPPSLVGGAHSPLIPAELQQGIFPAQNPWTCYSQAWKERTWELQ